MRSKVFRVDGSATGLNACLYNGESKAYAAALAVPYSLWTIKGFEKAANRAAATEEINGVNTRAGSAILYYRTSPGLKSLGNQKAVSSSNGLFNEAGEKALAQSEKDPHAGIWHLKIKVGQTMHKAAASKISATGWLLITIDTDS